MKCLFKALTLDKQELNLMLVENYTLDYKLSPNFPIADMVRSSTAARHDIDQLVHLRPEIVEAAKLLAVHVAEKLRARFGPFSPNSWFRSPPLEKILCEKSYAKWCKANKRKEGPKAWTDYLALKSHPKGAAMDIEFPGISNLDLFNWCKENLEFDQLILEFHDPKVPSSGWVHISFALHNRNQVRHIG